LESLLSGVSGLDFQGLLHPDVWNKAQQLATTFDSDRAVNDGVQAFYANLPLEAMRCDVDETNTARVLDPRHNLKLSMQAYVTVQPRRDESKGFVPF